MRHLGSASRVGVVTDQDEGEGLAVVAVATAVAGGRGKIGAASTAGLRRGACLPIVGFYIRSLEKHLLWSD